LPDVVHTGYRQVKGHDVLLQALAAAAGVDAGHADGEGGVDALIDLRHLRDLDLLCRDGLQPLLAALSKGELQVLALDFEDGALFTLRRAQRWRLWRRPLPRLDTAQPDHVPA